MSGTAFVISGGTAKGAYAAGLVHELFSTRPHLGKHLRYLSGTSTGSLIVPILGLWAVTGRRELLDRIPARYEVDSHEVWRPDPRTLFGRVVAGAADGLLKLGPMSPLAGHIAETGFGLDTTPLQEMIAREYKDELLEELFSLRDQVDVVVNCVSAQTGKVDVFSSADLRMTAAVYRDAIYASCLQPIFMPLQRVKHPSNDNAQEYMDGGIRDVIPVRAAWDRGATRVLAIALASTRTEPMKEDFSGRANLFKLLLRVMLGLLDQEVADDDVHEARYLATIGRLARYVPAEHLERELSLLGKAERDRYLAPERFDALCVHRPSPRAGLKEDLSWTKGQMIGWVQKGREAMRNGEGERLARFLEGRAHS